MKPLMISLGWGVLLCFLFLSAMAFSTIGGVWLAVGLSHVAHWLGVLMP